MKISNTISAIIYLFIHWPLSSRDKIIELWYIARYQLWYKIYKLSNHSIKSGFHPEAQQGILHLIRSFATRHSDSGMTRLETIQTVLEALKPQSLSPTMYSCHHFTRVWVKKFLLLRFCRSHWFVVLQSCYPLK